MMKADVGRAVSGRVYSPYSGRLTGECKKLGAEIARGTTTPSTSDVYRTDFSQATYEGTKLSSYKEYLGSTSNTTTYATTYLPSGRVSSTSAVTTVPTNAQAQDYSETFTYDGIGNISRVVATRETNTNNPRPDVRRNEAYTPVLGQQAGTVIDQVNKVTDSGTAVGRSALQVKYGYDLSNRLVSVTRSAGSSETLDYGPSGELSHRRVDGKDVFYVGEYATVTASNCSTDCKATENSVAVDAHLIYAGTRIASARKASLDGLTSGRTLYYYRTRLGSVIGTSLREGVKGAFYRYTPYGEIDRTDENDAGKEAARSDLGYTNALRLSGGLIHLVNRAYDPEAKVFVQADVVDRLRYAYTGGDPINRSDPTGLVWVQNPVSQSIAQMNASMDGGFMRFEPVVHGSEQKAAGSGQAEPKAPEKPPAAGTEDPKANAQANTGLKQEDGEAKGNSQSKGNSGKAQICPADPAKRAQRDEARKAMPKDRERLTREVGGLIYDMPDGSTGHTTVVGTTTTVIPEARPPPSGARVRGMYHAHPGYGYFNVGGDFVLTGDPNQTQLLNDDWTRPHDLDSARDAAKKYNDPLYEEYLFVPGSPSIKVFIPSTNTECELPP